MNLQYFGDSYDIVKKSLLHWLSDFGPWIAHPMFTHATRPEEVKRFARFLGVRLISTEVLMSDSDRDQYFACCRLYSHSLFLDPDTGIRLKAGKDSRAPEYVFADELSRLTQERPGALTLTFDQSLQRGNEESPVRKKLQHFKGCGLHGFSYFSHTSFVLLGNNAALVNRARQQLLAQSGLPDWRILRSDNS